jgi:hypothetical protein
MNRIMTFKDAVIGTEGLASAYRPGLQGLREVDRNRITCKNPRSLTGSVDLDEALKESHPHDNRWDYGVGIAIDKKTDDVIWIEVHPASSHHIEEVLKKHRWLLGWLASSAPLLGQMNAKFVWIATGKVSIPQGSPQRRRIGELDIHLAGQHYQV